MTSKTPRSCFPRCLLALLAFVSLLSVPLVCAAEPAKRTFNIPADVAEKSIKQFSVQSSVDVVFGTVSATQTRTNAVTGTLAPREALERLLAGTGLVAVHDEKTGTATISRPDVPPAKKEPARAESTPPARAATDIAVVLEQFVVKPETDTSYLSKRTTAATKTNEAIRDTPASITVLSRALLDDLQPAFASPIPRPCQSCDRS